MKYFFTLSFIIALTLFCQGQPENEIKSVIGKFFEGMVKGDSVLVHSTLNSQCVLKSVIRKKEGTTVVVDEPVKEFLNFVGSPPKSKFEEQLLSYDIKLDGDMAMVWTPYKFYMDEKLSHCGVNVFMMVKNNTWTILSITDTRRRNCE
jgi:uncharacterized protein YacL (UPF0231 family)